MARRDYRTGAVYQRKADWRLAATVEIGWSESGARRRRVVTSKGCVGGCAARCPHRAEIKRRLRDLRLSLERGQTSTSAKTVKAWATEYLEMRVRDLAPKAYNAAASPIRKWVVPTIGHKRLDTLTPGDIRAVQTAQRKAGRQVGDTHRALMTMLRAAVRDGHQIPPSVLAVKAPKPEKSDRMGMTVPEGLAVIEAASHAPDGIRWLTTLLYGARMGECLGLTWPQVDLEAGAHGEIVIEWQLQPLPYIVPRDRSSGFRVPDGYEVRHLVDSYHLVRPKSRSGYRVAPLLPSMREALLAWREKAPTNTYGLVWPEPNGRPRNDKHDRAAWAKLQATAGVAHPSGRPYYVHECRNFAATMLLEAGVDEHVITTLLGHSSIVMSRKYMTVRREPLLEAMTKVGDRLQLG